MSIFDSLSGLIGGVADSVQGSIGDAVGGIADNQVVQDLQDQAATATDGAADALNSVTEQGQATVEDISSDLGL